MSATRVSKQSLGASTLWNIARAYANDSFKGERREQVLGMIRARNVSALCSLDLPDPEFHGPEFVHLRQLQAFFKKNAWFSDPAVCSDSARKSFLQAEQVCSDTNRRIEDYYTGRSQIDSDLREHLEAASSFIKGALGDLNTFIDRIPDLVKVTGGATEDRPRKRALPYLKISRKLRTTSRSVPLLTSYLTYVGSKKAPRITHQDTNRIVYVPKNYKTHRTIACEPTATLPFQLAFDSYVKGRLKRYGCDLSTQERNQEYARLGSIDQSYATLDLSMASDTLAYNTVALLVPDDWFQFIDRLRCRGYKGDVGEGSYAKFSSMGNGMTFALETLVFLACIRAVGSSSGITYGDDIIVEPEFVKPLVALLQFLGFSINMEKSYIDGPFRESCGADWLNGVLVTPVYIRQLPQHPSEWCHVVNSLSRISLPYGELWYYLREISLRFPLVPVSEDTATGIHVEYERCRELGLVSSNSKRYGPWVAVAKQFTQVPDTTYSAGIRSYVLYLLFRGRVHTGYVRQSDGKFKVIEPTSLGTWDTGRVRRVLMNTPVRPWSSSSAVFGLWSEFVSERRRKQRQ